MFPFDQMKRLKHSSLLNSVHLKLSFQIIKYFEVQVELLCLAFLFLSDKLLQLANHSPAWNTTLYYCIITRKLKERLNAVKFFLACSSNQCQKQAKEFLRFDLLTSNSCSLWIKSTQNISSVKTDKHWCSYPQLQPLIAFVWTLEGS